MSITTIGNINQVCETSVNPQRAEEKIYFDGQPRLGMVLYTDKGKNTRKTAGIYGLKFQGKTYKIQADNQGIVTVFDGQCSEAVLPKRFIAYQYVNTWDVNNNIPLLKEQTDEMIAAGANCIHVSIIFDYVFTSHAQLQANNESSWTKYDEWFQHIASKNVSVALRICLGMDDNYLEQFWGAENASKDPWGYIYKPFYGNNIPCLSSNIGRNMMIDFFTKVCDRYMPLFGNKLLFIQPSTQSSQEFGGEFRNRQFPEPEYPSFGDYNQQNIVGFREYCRGIYNNNIQLLKDAWGFLSFGWASFDDVLPPYPPNSNRFETSWGGLRIMLNGKRGIDWHQFHQKSYEKLFEDLTTIVKARNSSVDMSLLFGTCSNEISLSYLSHNVKAWCRKTDNIQTLYSRRDFRDFFDDMSADWVRSLADKDIYTEVADFDAYNSSAALTYSRKALDEGAKFLAIVSDKANIDRWNNFKTLVSTLVAEYANKPVEFPSWDGSINASLSEAIHDWPAIEQRWRAAGGSKTKRIQINFTEN
jgi:hypothetical protein